MTINHLYHRTNLAAGRYVDLTVSPEQDVSSAARDLLTDSGLDPQIQLGYFVSVFPSPAAE
ncbi:hypothetical protein ABIB25_003144 [Nakamurella sp. UYEF19]|uniref:hypothetical protein n=1 Tax=Nakamurella sp. UYEF19 TaxID=1756392 RepID=UPI003397815D